MNVRERRSSDLPACVDALRQTYEASNYPTRWPADPAGWLSPPHLLQTWVAEHDGVIIGQAGLQSGAGEPGLAAATGLPADGLALVTRLFVAPAGRGLGLARGLIAVILDRAAELGLRVGLDVTEDSTAAIALYESLGWSNHGRERAAWRTQDGEYPMIRYYLSPS